MQRFVSASAQDPVAPQQGSHFRAALEDLECLTTHVPTKEERVKARIRLELMTHREIIGDILFLLLFCTFSIVSDVVIVSFSRTREIQHSESSTVTHTNYLPALLGIDITLRIICLGLLCIFFLTFGRKLIYLSCKRHLLFSGEQSLVFFIAILLFLGPGSGLYFVIEYLVNIDAYLRLMDPDKNFSDLPHHKVQQELSRTILNPAHSLYTPVEEVFSRVITVFTMITYYALYIIMKSVLATRIKADREHKGLSFWTRYVKPLEGVLALSFGYFIVTIILASVWDFAPSFVPFVSMISIIRVCSQSVSSFPDLNAQVFNYSDAYDNDKTMCMQEKTFPRIICQTIIFTMELVLLWYTFRVTGECRDLLRNLPYKTNKSRHLGYQFFSFTMGITFFFLFVNCIILVSVPSASLWVIEFEQDHFNVDPLHLMGLPSEAIGMSTVFLLLTATLICHAFAYLPASAVAVVDQCYWCVSCVLDPLQCGRGAENENNGKSQEVIYYCKEEEIDNYLKEKRDDEGDPALNDLAQLLNFKLRKEKESWSERALKIEKSEEPYRKLKSEPSDHVGENEMTDAVYPMTEEKLSAVEYARLRVLATRSNIVVFESMIQTFTLTHLVYDFVERFKDLIGEAESKTRAEAKESANGYAGITGSGRQTSFNCLYPNCDCDPHKNVLKYDKFLRKAKPTDHAANPDPRVNPNIVSRMDAQAEFENARSEMVGDALVLTFKAQQFLTFVGPTKGLEIVNYIYWRRWDTHCLIAANEHKIIVSFRGTVSKENRDTDADILMTPYQFPRQADDIACMLQSPKLRKYAARMRTHRGFASALSGIERALMGCLRNLLAENAKRVLFTTGHSLGGALSTVAAMNLFVLLNAPSSEYFFRTQDGLPVLVANHTYASPRAGNYYFMRFFQKVIQSCYRVSFVRDVIPSLPPSQPFSSLTRMGYFHCGLQILLDGQGNMLLGPSFVERTVYNLLKGFSIAKHFKGSYSLGFITWNIRNHGADYNPDWWLPIINHLYAFYARELSLFPSEVAADIRTQLTKENAFYVSSFNVLHKHSEMQTEVSGAQFDEAWSKYQVEPA